MVDMVAAAAELGAMISGTVGPPSTTFGIPLAVDAVWPLQWQEMVYVPAHSHRNTLVQCMQSSIRKA